jgi:hypothetical protein
MRDARIDLLRFVGLAMIILAHSGPNDLIFQLRNFDVPLMVIVAGLSFRASYKEEPYFSYLFKRFRRLVLPVWIFLSLYFVVVRLLGYPPTVVTPKIMASSYLLLSGIGYVWVIRVFLLVACISPMILAWSDRTPSTNRYLSALAIVYAAYEILLFFVKPYLGSTVGHAFEYTGLYLLPYAIVFALGLRLSTMRTNELAGLNLMMLALFVALAFMLSRQAGEFVSTQDYKYPPQAYYLAYALMVSISLWLVSGKIVLMLESSAIGTLVGFIARNSIWIYLWHIPFVEGLVLPVWVKYPVVFAGATLITAMQVRFVRTYLIPRFGSQIMRRNLNSLFTG